MAKKIRQDKKLAEKVMGLLNDMYRRDPEATDALIRNRVCCNRALSDHPTIQVVCGDSPDRDVVGMLGVLNGLCGTIDKGPHKGWGMICSMHDEKTGRLLGFSWLDDPKIFVRRGMSAMVDAGAKHGRTPLR